MNFKLCFVFLFIGFIFLNLSCVCADVEDNSTVVGDSFNEFEMLMLFMIILMN